MELHGVGIIKVRYTDGSTNIIEGRAYGLKPQCFTVTAIFHEEAQVVFESFKRSECVKYCHEHGMRALAQPEYENAVMASFRKINAKKPFRAEDYKLGVVNC